MVVEMDDVEAVLERIWDLHDKVSDAIHSISRSHFLSSVKKSSPEKKDRTAGDGGGGGASGFVFVKDFRRAEDEAAAATAMAEARSLNAIRTALENLEDQLEFFHTVQSQQRADRDAAIARVEQSRIILARRLADHQGKKYKVIEEALAFVGDVHDKSRLVAPENLHEMPRDQSGENLDGHDGQKSMVLVQMLISSLTLAKDSLKLEKIGGVLGNAALFAVSMIAFLQLHQVAFKAPQIPNQNIYRKNEKRTSHPDVSSQVKNFDVFSARG